MASILFYDFIKRSKNAICNVLKINSINEMLDLRKKAGFFI